ncbi:MAG: tetratricopeptide repeat protein [Cyanobacteria bacterium P01_G01_bin.54]
MIKSAYLPLSLLTLVALVSPATAQLNPEPPQPKLTLSPNATPGEDCEPGIPDCPHTVRCTNGLPGCFDRPQVDVRGVDWSWVQSETIPYVLSPRRTLLLNAQPRLRWQPIAAADYYRVIVLNEMTGQVVWEVKSPTAELDYAGPRLVVGQEYSLEIHAYTAESDVPIATSLKEPHFATFALLGADQRAALQAQTQRIEQTVTDPEQQQRQLANLYLRNGLFIEGMQLLEDQWQSQTNAALAVRLGNLYFYELRLPLEAQAYYEQAVAQSADDLELRAIALTELGYTQKVLLNYDGAIAHWQQAIAIYQTLGDRAKIERLEQELREAEDLRDL